MVFIIEENTQIDKIKSKEPQDTRKKTQNSSINQRLDNSSAKISKNGENIIIPEGKVMTPTKLDNISRNLNKNKIRNYNSEKKISETDKIKDSKMLYIMSQTKANDQKECKSKEESKKDKSLNNSNQSKEKHSYTSVVKDKIEYLKIEMKIIELNINMDYLKLSEALISESSINSALINVEKMNCDYLDNLNQKLINGMKNLANLYNFNLWRKVSNMLLKNIFVILKNNKFEFRQNPSNSIKNILASNAYKNNIYNEQFELKIKKYENKFNSYNNNIIIQNLSNAADEKKGYNLVTIYKDNKPDIIASLSSDFLFFLKEKGNQVNHFDEKVLNFILFNNMNIIVVKIEEENTNIIINEDDNDVFDKEYEGRINFDFNEIISMLKNPLSFIKDDYIDIKILFSPIYSKIEKIRELIGYNNSFNQIKDLKEKVVNISENIKILFYK